jgi:hypothetical protein
MKLLFNNIVYLFAFGTMPLLAQTSGFASVGHGYYSNPLYNYQHRGDQIQSGYGELNYLKQDTSSSFETHYAGGLSLFHQQFTRTYYEHSLSSRYVITWKTPNHKKDLKFNPVPVATLPDSSDSLEKKNNADHDSVDVKEEDSQNLAKTIESDLSNDVENEEDTFENVTDTTGKYLSSKIIFSNRIDRRDYHTYNNWSVSAECLYKLPVFDNYFLRLIEQPLYRSYPYQNDLSHVANSFIVLLNFSFGEVYETGFSLASGVKYYTNATTPEPIYNMDSTITRQGGGRTVTYDSTIVGYLSDSTRTITQFVLQYYIAKKWESGNIWAEVVYRINPKQSVRQFLPDSTFSSLTDDLYNEEFSYEGAAATIRLNQTIENFANCLFTVSASQKKYSAEAFDIRGNEKGKKRRDIVWECEMYCSHFFSLSPNFGVETYVDAQYVRNQSNDEYNDFSSWSLSAGLGIGF